MAEKKKEEKKTKCGIWSEDMKRHGKCWRFEISWFDSAGQRHRKRGSGYPSKSECEVVVTEILRKARLEKMGLSLPEPKKKLPNTTLMTGKLAGSPLE